MFGIKPKTLHYWYKECFSDYRKDIAEGRWGSKRIQVVDTQSGEVVKEKPVPIASPENMGTHMTIDEKQIGKKMYTIMTNAQTGKIALLAQTMKPEELKQAIENYLGGQTSAVVSVSCDMSPSYKKLCREAFPNTRLVIDKFHVIKHLMDALQQVRKQLKTNCIIDERIKNDSQPEMQWTMVEMLERSRYILFKMQEEWDADEREIMGILFQRYPLLAQAWQLTQRLRTWYNGKNVGKPLELLERELYNWCDDVAFSKIAAFKAVKKMIEKHHDDILNYFREGQTNAKAENMNGKIQRFLANNFGIKDRDFFLYRLKGYFA
jgi:transposase